MRPAAVDSAAVGARIAVAATIAVGALVWGVMYRPRPTRKSSDGSYDRVELIGGDVA